MVVRDIEREDERSILLEVVQIHADRRSETMLPNPERAPPWPLGRSAYLFVRGSEFEDEEGFGRGWATRESESDEQRVQTKKCLPTSLDRKSSHSPTRTRANYI